MKKTLYWALPLIALLVISLWGAFTFRASPWSHDHARAEALRRVTQTCVTRGGDPKLLSGPKEVTVGNEAWAFEWVYQGRPRYLYGVWFSHSGQVTLYGGDPDDPQSAAYAPR